MDYNKYNSLEADQLKSQLKASLERNNAPTSSVMHYFETAEQFGEDSEFIVENSIDQLLHSPSVSNNNTTESSVDDFGYFVLSDSHVSQLANCLDLEEETLRSIIFRILRIPNETDMIGLNEYLSDVKSDNMFDGDPTRMTVSDQQDNSTQTREESIESVNLSTSLRDQCFIEKSLPQPTHIFNQDSHDVMSSSCVNQKSVYEEQLQDAESVKPLDLTLTKDRLNGSIIQISTPNNENDSAVLNVSPISSLLEPLRSRNQTLVEENFWDPIYEVLKAGKKNKERPKSECSDIFRDCE